MSEVETQDPPQAEDAPIFTLAEHAAELLEGETKKPQEEPFPDIFAEDEQKEEPAAQEPAEEKVSNEEKAEEPKAEAPDEEDFGFEGEQEQAKDEFDAEEFDKETEAGLTGDEKSDNRWKELRLELKELKQGKNAITPEVQEKLAEAERAASRVKELEEQVAKLTEEDYQIKVKATPEYQDKVDGAIERVRKSAISVIEAYKLDGARVEAALNEDNLAKRVERIAELKTDEDGNSVLPQVIQNKLMDMADELQSVNDIEKRLMANGKAEWDTIQAKRAEEAAQAERKAQEAKSMVAQEFASKFEARPEIQESPELKTALKNATLRARTMDLAAETPRNQVLAAVSGEMLPKYMKLVRELRGELQSLRGAKKAEHEASPNLSQGAAGESPTKKEPETLEEILQAHRERDLL